MTAQEIAESFAKAMEEPTDRDLLPKDYKSKALNGVGSRRSRAHRTFLNIEKKKEFLLHVKWAYYERLGRV